MPLCGAVGAKLGRWLRRLQVPCSGNRSKLQERIHHGQFYRRSKLHWYLDWLFDHYITLLIRCYIHDHSSHCYMTCRFADEVMFSVLRLTDFLFLLLWFSLADELTFESHTFTLHDFNSILLQVRDYIFSLSFQTVLLSQVRSLRIFLADFLFKQFCFPKFAGVF